MATDKNGVVVYMKNDEKAKYLSEYPFLKDALNNNVVSLYITPCRTLPKMEGRSDFGGSYIDSYNETWEEFKDSKNTYRLQDVKLDSGSGNASFVDHTFNLYVRDNSIKPRLLVLSGPSGVGKGPIVDWLKKIYFPGLLEGEDIKELCQVKVRKSLTERYTGKGEDIGKGQGNNLKEIYCRGKPQWLDLDQINHALESHDTVLLEAYYKSFDFLKAEYGNSTEFVPVFISPLSKEEIKELFDQGKTLEDPLLKMMPNSLVERSKLEGKIFTQSLLEEIILRGEDSINEMKFAHNYKKVIPNHCPESDPRWKLQSLIGEPRKVVDILYQIIITGDSNLADSGKDYYFLGGNNKNE